MLFDLFRHTISAFVWMELPPPLASGANRIFRLTFAEQWKSRRFNVLPQLRPRLHGSGQIFARTNFVPVLPVYMDPCKFCCSGVYTDPCKV